MKKANRWVSFFRPAPLKAKLQKGYFKINRFIKGRPLTAFFVSLAILLLVIIAGNFLTKPKAVVTPPPAPKDVNVYTIGKTPTVKVQAQVQKDGVITIMAQTSGIVQNVAVKEGDAVQRGTNLVSLSTNYQGGNAPSLSRQLAQVQFQNINDTFDKQKDLIQKQRDLADKSSDNTEQLRQISVQNQNDTNSLLSLNQDIVSTLNSNLTNLQNNNVGGINDQLILATKQQISSFQSAVNQLSATSRSLSYTTDTSKNPTQIVNITRDLALEQLDIQQKALELSKKVAQIQLNIAQVAEAQMFPSSPISGVVQKVFVHAGQSVNAGTPLVTIYNAGGNVSAVAKVPQSIARSASKIETSSILIANKVFSTTPSFISTEATDGQLYSIVFDIPEDYQSDLTNLEYVTVEIPVGHSDSNAIIPFIPIDSVFQTQEKSYIYVVKDQKAVAKNIVLGNVLGSDVEVKSGFEDGSQIILNRNIIEGDLVTPKN